MDMQEKILLVEDALEIQFIVQTALKAHCRLDCAGTLAEGQNFLRQNSYSLILLDGHLPDGDGFEFCKNLREIDEYRDLPIIFLTGQSETARKVLGFSLGADDYITKPIDPAEFTARVMSKLTRAQASSTSFQKGDFHVDLKAQKVHLKENGQQQNLGLTPIELKILVHFFRNENKVFSREEILRQVWGEKVHVSGHTVDTHISSLRKKLGPAAAMIKAVVKNGYSFSLSGK